MLFPHHNCHKVLHFPHIIHLPMLRDLLRTVTEKLTIILLISRVALTLTVIHTYYLLTQLTESQVSAVTQHLSRVICDNDLVSVLFKAVYLWYAKHVDDSNRERLHERVSDVSIIIKQALKALGKSLQHTITTPHSQQARLEYAWEHGTGREHQMSNKRALKAWPLQRERVPSSRDGKEFNRMRWRRAWWAISL